MKNEGLNAKQEKIVTIAAFTAKGDLDRLKAALNEGLDAGLTVNEIKEILVQMYAYTGFPRSLNGLGAFMGVMEERQKKGIRDEPGRRAKSPARRQEQTRTRNGNSDTPDRITGQWGDLYLRPRNRCLLERTPVRGHLRARQPGFPEQGNRNHIRPGRYGRGQPPTTGPFQHRVQYRPDRGSDEEPHIRPRGQSRQKGFACFHIGLVNALCQSIAKRGSEFSTKS